MFHHHSSNSLQILSKLPLNLKRSLSTRVHDLYPYPAHTNPTPHQIFHLPTSASQADIKQRYYDLVKLHHPDAPGPRHLPPKVAQARFHSILTAYDVLRGRHPSMTAAESVDSQKRRNLRDLNAAIWRARQRHKADVYVNVTDDRWKDRLFLGLLAMTILGFILQMTTTRSRLIAGSLELSRQQAQNHRQEQNMERRRREEAILSATEET